ncbi:MOSC N-terminal beta barrel domain-containing protein [Quadrisphaera sp. INWT6]|uniref:MOSC N-terminal beta barrel domain-containing protein n=1 Tax=Quadrisphaera sp. INWT6 TaxID=2596917 RepID=UPI00189246A8|nr:MOSC N-terminal beta barrel domain-containing protein [Quadrisphaera sp. INWT6]
MPLQTPSGVVVGTVALLRRFPLRSAAGDQPLRALLLAGGLEHDRRWQLVDASGVPVHRRDAPGIAALTASVGDDGELHLTGGGAAPAEHLAGPGARFADGAGASGAGEGERARPDAPVHLVSAGAAEALLQDDGSLPGGCDPGGRANAVIALDPAVAEPGAERGWVGRRLGIGGAGGAAGAVLLLTRTPRRCLGVYADVLVTGEVAVGDDVVLLDG